MRVVFYNGNVYTGELPLVSAFIVEDGRFTDVGSDEAILKAAEPGDNLINLNGDFVCAGFNDSHMHLLNFGLTLSYAPLYRNTESLKAVMDCMREHLRLHPVSEGQWLCGRGWNQDFFKDTTRMPSRWDLDEVSRDVPIMITRTCGHCCVVNSKLLELAGITSETESPSGGRIGVENGEIDGRLYDNAMDILDVCRPIPTKEDIKRMILLAASELNRYGITSAQTDDYCVFRDVPADVVNSAYRELEKAEMLTVRVCEQCNFTEPEALKAFIASGETEKGSDFFKTGPLKLLGDGALGSRTAHLSKPYKGTDSYGFSLFSPEHMKRMVACANAHGMDAAIHAIGDACLDEVLDAIECALRENPRPEHRHGVVHCQVSRADQLERMIRLGVHIYAQTIFLDYDNHIIEKLVPDDLAKTSYCWKTLLKNGLNVSNGSDCPVELPDVMKGIECAVTRTSMDGTGPYLPDEAFTVREAIDSFTSSSAIASHDECIKGTIKKGMLADFVILGANPFDADARAIHRIPVKATFVGGREVFRA